MKTPYPILDVSGLIVMAQQKFFKHVAGLPRGVLGVSRRFASSHSLFIYPKRAV